MTTPKPTSTKGRKRFFFGGVLAGIVFTVMATLTVMYSLDITLGPPGYPHYSEKSARQATLEWARLTPFPLEIQSYTIVTSGSMFTRQFRVSFFGEPTLIDQWVQSCPGVMDAKTIKTESPDGTITYTIPAGGGAVRAVLTHHPVRGTISIIASWS